MRKIHVRALAAALSVLTVLSLAAGCSKSKANPASASSNSNISEKDGFFWSKEPITISMLFSDNSAYPYKDSWTFFKTLQEKTNVKIDPTIVNMSDYNNKRSVLIASGQEPQIIPKTYPGSEDQFVTSGQIIPVSDYLQYMPNFSKELKDWKLADDLKTITQGDGKYYIMPGLHQSFIQDYAVCMRTDILKKNKITPPETWDQFYDVLKQLKQLYPNVTPFSDHWQLGALMQMAGPAFVKAQTGLKGTDADWSPVNLVAYDADKDNFTFFPTTDAYKQELAFFNKLISEGLIDKESLTQTSDTGINKFGSGKCFATTCNSQSITNDFKPKLDANLGEGNWEVTKLNALAGPAGNVIVGNRLENGVMITKKAKDDPNFTTILGFVDWLWNSYKGQEFCKLGIENETFTKSGDTYKMKDGYELPAYGLTSTANAKDIRKEMGFGSGVFVLSYGGPDALAHAYMTKTDIDYSENVNKTRTLLPNAPKIGYDEDTQETQDMLNATLKDYYNQASVKFILGQMNLDTDWDSYVKQFKDKGSDKYTQTANDTYAKQKK